MIEFLKRRVARAAALSVLAASGLVFYGSAVLAQQNDAFTINIDNSHFNPIPATGLADYIVRIDNAGNFATSPTTVSFTVPADTVYEGVSGLTGCDPESGAGPLIVVCDLPALPVDGDILARVNLRHQVEGAFSLAASIPNGTSFTRSTTVQRGADLSVTLTASPTTIQAGNFGEFIASVTNQGPYAASNAVLEVTIPTGLSSNIDLSGYPGCAVQGALITCSISALAVGQTLDFSFRSQATAADLSTATMSAQVRSGTPRDPITDNNTATANLTIEPGTDVLLSKSRAPLGLLLIGDTANFTLQPQFVGRAPQRATIVDQVPSNYEITGVTASQGWSCIVSGQTVDCAFTGGAGANFTNPIVIETVAAEVGQNVVNTARIDSLDENAGADGNNVASDTRADIQAPSIDLVAYKSGPPRGLVTVGNSYSFDLSSRNEGNAPFAQQLTITDHLPAGLTATNIVMPTGWSCPAVPVGGLVGPQDIVCVTDQYISSPLAPGASTAAITLTAEVTGQGAISNGMTVSFEDYNDDDVDPANNTTSSGVTSADPTNAADVSVLKTRIAPAAGVAIASGDPVTFRIEVVNTGPTPAEDVRMTDRLEPIVNPQGGQPTQEPPVNASGMSCTVPSRGQFSRDLECNIATLPTCVPGVDCPWVEVTVHVGRDGPQTNTAVAYSYLTPDPDTSNNVSSASYTVEPRTDVTVTKTSPSLNSGAAVGQPLTYVITAAVPQNGLSPAESVTVTDILPDGVRFISATPSTGACSVTPPTGSVTDTTNNIFECNLGTINNGSQQTVAVVVVPTLPLVGTQIINNVTVSTATPETNTTNNTASVPVTINPPVLDLIIGKVDSIDPLEIDTDTVYRITLTNAGPSDATNVTIVDDLPVSGLADPRLPATPLPNGWSCQFAGTSTTAPGGTMTCENAYVPAGQVTVIDLTMKGVQRGRHVNSVEVTSAETQAGYETIADNNFSTEDTTVRVRSDVQVTKTAVTLADPSVTVDVVDLREEFAWKIDVTALAGPGLDIAEAVTLADTLPQGMVLTQIPTTTRGTCSGAAGGRVIGCELGDIDVGEIVTVMLRVRMIQATHGARVSNTATAATQSFDRNTGNNSGTGSITTVRAGAISGTIWRDFNDDGSRQADDSGIANVVVNLSGTAQHDGEQITLSVATAADGTYLFEDLPPGTYQVSYETPSPSRLEVGRALPGSGTATSSIDTAIANIVVVRDETSSAHDFTLIPQAQLAIEKTAGTPVFQADGSYTIAYAVAVRNLSEEPLANVVVTDDLSDPSRNFGTYTADLAPAEGSYTVTQAPLPAFTGQPGADSLLVAGTLAVGQTLNLTYTLRVNPDVPRRQPFAHENAVSVTGEGSLSQQTPATNPDLEAGDTATATPVFVPGIEIVKTETFDGTGTISVGDRIDYTFRITNTGNTPLENVTITDDLPDLQGLDVSPISRLAPQAFVDRTAHYILTQFDLDRGEVVNSASTSGEWGDSGGTPLTVMDDDGATVSSLTQPELTIDKSISSTTVTDPTVLGQTITYQFVVTNTGNANLRDVLVIDPLLGTLPALAIGDLPVTESRTVTATYTVDQDDINRGRVDNTAFARGTSGPAGSTTTTDSLDDSETQPLYPSPSLVLVKQVDAASVPDEPRAGNQVTWTVTATNTGNVTLTDLTLSDPIAGAVIAPVSHASVAPNNSVSFTVTAPLTQDHINAGEVQNQALINFETPEGPGTPVNSGNDPNGPEEPTTTPLNPKPAIGLVKEMISSIPATIAEGTELRYRFTIRNLGNLPLSSLVLDDDLPGFVLDDASITLLASTTLAPVNAAGDLSGTEIIVEGTYPLIQQNIEDGSVTNQAQISAFPTHGPTGTPVTDMSGTDFDNDAPTVASLDRDPQVRLIKTISQTSFTGTPVAGDTITYAFEIRNIGNVVLTNLVIDEMIIGATVNNPTNWSGPLGPTEVESAAITATYVLQQADIERGFVENSARVTGVGTGADGQLAIVTDISGSTVGDDDPTRIDLVTDSGIEIVKSYEAALSSPPQIGDVVTYRFLVTNKGNLTLNNVTIADPLPDLDMPVTVIATLLPGAPNAVELTGTYVVKQSDIQNGEIVNQAGVTGDYTDPLTGSGTETASSDRIVIPLLQTPGIAVIKSASAALSEPAIRGEEIEYTFVVRNTGNLELTGVVVDDPLPGLNPGQFLIGDMAPGEERTVGPAIYAIGQDDIDRGEVINQATATGTYDNGNGPTPVSDLSGPTFTDDEPIIIEVVQPLPALTIEKTGTFVGGSAYALVGDRIDFEFVISNTGNVAITDVSPREVSFSFGSIPAETDISVFEPLSTNLQPGQSATFRATYVLSQGDLNAAAGMNEGVNNVAEARGTFDAAEITSPSDTATLTLLPQPPSDVSITKSTTRPDIRRGETVPFLISVVNKSLADAGLVEITDRIPSGFFFVEGSASVNGTQFTPRIDGNEVVFENLRLAPSSTIDIRLVLRALPATSPGRYTNIAIGRDALGSPLAPDARAHVEILAEAVFDCSDVIGTVFNDFNGNGYQDKGEPGIPAVRLSTARGILVRTDAFGRFSIPCAALPAANIGSNFVLKIDDRTLPSGFALTTDNPAMVRLTPGKMAEINFGVALGREVRMTLGDEAFVAGGSQLTKAMASGVDQLIDLLSKERSRLFVTFETAQPALSRTRMQTMISLVRDHWRRAGEPYDLQIETTVVER